MNMNCSKYPILWFYRSTSPWVHLRTRLQRESVSWVKVTSLEGVFYSQKTLITSWVSFSYIWIFDIRNCTLPHIMKNLTEALPLLPWADNHCSYGMNLMHIDITGCEVTAGLFYLLIFVPSELNRLSNTYLEVSIDDRHLVLKNQIST